MKIDVQGGEMKVLRGATDLLLKASIIMTEVEFAPIYKNQPLFSDIDAFLREHGFFLLDLYNESHVPYKASLFGDLKSRLMWADAVYVKEMKKLETLGRNKILKALIISHIILHDPSLSCQLLELYDKINESAFQNVYQAQMHLMRRCY